jgi:hypothetical protein
MTSGKSRIPPRLRETVTRAAGYHCGYCRTDQRITGYQLTIDHIGPQSRGGKTVEENLWLACIACNQHKGAQIYGNDPGSDEKVMLRVSLTNECEQGTQASRLLLHQQARRLRSLCQPYLFITTMIR